MIGLLQRKSLQFLHPLLKRALNYYYSKPRKYKGNGLKLIIYPSVFHPGLHYSTGLFLEFLEGLDLEGKKVLELGAGSGMISFFSARNGAIVTASDINQTALAGIQENASSNGLQVRTIYSDLFDEINISDFDLILINPPYYPRKAKDATEKAWFCGEDFEYFRKLFNQVADETQVPTIFMILSEDCALDRISLIAKQSGFEMIKVFEKIKRGEKNYIFKLQPAAK